MPKSTPTHPTNNRMAKVHALGHPASAAPRTKWAGLSQRRSGERDPQVVVVAVTPSAPGATAAPTLAPGTGSDLIVSWSAPGATGFNLRSSPAGAGTWTTVTGVSTPYAITGLPTSAAIDVQVQSLNAVGVGPWSATSTRTTAGPAVPNAPVMASVTPPPDGTNSKLSVSWAASAGATGYNLRQGPAGAGTWTTVTSVSSPYTITGLAGAAAIDVQVQAVNAGGSGAWSTIMTGTTWGVTVAPGNWVAATTQVHGTAVAPNGGVNAVAAAAPTAVTGLSFAWSTSNSSIPTTGLIAAGGNGQTNGWGQWFNAPASAGTYYLWMLAQSAGGFTSGGQVTGAITVT